jgi:hypothetical protein
MTTNETLTLRVRRRQSSVMSVGVGVAALGLLLTAVGLPAALSWLLVISGGAAASWAAWWFGALARAVAAGTPMAAVTSHGARIGPLLTLTASPTGHAGMRGHGELQLLVPTSGAVGGSVPVTVVGDLAAGMVVVATATALSMPLRPGRWVGGRSLDSNAVRSLT